jgi:hypothetical protein
MCECPLDEGQPLITAIEDRHLAKGGVLVCHVRFRNGAYVPRNAVTFYSNHAKAIAGANKWASETILVR